MGKVKKRTLGFFPVESCQQPSLSPVLHHLQGNEMCVKFVHSDSSGGPMSFWVFGPKVSYTVMSSEQLRMDLPARRISTRGLSSMPGLHCGLSNAGW